MNTPVTIQSLADKMISEAEGVYAIGYYDLSFYIAGYAVELYIKARISKHLNIPDFFDFGNRPRFENEDNITKPYKVHDYKQLLILSGLFHDYNTMMYDAKYRNDWSILKKWKESARYDTGKSASDASIFITSVKNFILWIKQY